MGYIISDVLGILGWHGRTWSAHRREHDRGGNEMNKVRDISEGIRDRLGGPRRVRKARRHKTSAAANTLPSGREYGIYIYIYIYKE